MRQATIDTTRRTSPEKRPSYAVVRAVAEAENVDPADLETPLYDVVDPEALDRLFEPVAGRPSVGGHVAFTYAGYAVRIDATGRLSVSEVDGAGDRSRR